MAKIVSQKPSRPPSDAEADLLAWFEEQEAKSVDNLEAGAKQLISLISAFYGLIFGVLALGDDKFAASLGQGGVFLFALGAIFFLLLALVLALIVVAPRRYEYRDASLDDMQALFMRILRYKSRSLLGATISFGFGLVAFAGLIALMMFARI